MSDSGANIESFVLRHSGSFNIRQSTLVFRLHSPENAKKLCDALRMARRIFEIILSLAGESKLHELVDVIIDLSRCVMNTES